MRKILTTLTVLAAAGAVHAQSSLTLFGVVDTALQHGSGSVSNRTHLTPSGNQASRLGLRGTEDLGGGMSASFWLEADVRTDDGTGAATNTNNQASGGAPAGGLGGGQGLTFNRRSTVSLAGSWGEVRLGRDYTTQFLNLTVFDPFGTLGVGTAQTLVSGLGGPVAARASNSVGYLLPGNLGGLYGLVQYYLGENQRDGKREGRPRRRHPRRLCQRPLQRRAGDLLDRVPRGRYPPDQPRRALELRLCHSNGSLCA